MQADRDQDESRRYTVLINAEEQYSLWPKEKAVPPGWREVGQEGTRAECAAYVDATWLDMRPLSLRQAMSAR